MLGRDFTDALLPIRDGASTPVCAVATATNMTTESTEQDFFIIIQSPCLVLSPSILHLP
jgi:hypothetical protein